MKMSQEVSIIICRLKRYVKYGLQYFLLEKPRGLDFTMRDTHLLKEGQGLHGYSKTNEKHLREVFLTLEINDSDCLLDVGCGKGAVLKEAAKFPFKRIAGIDIDSRLIEIAKKNFNILKLSDRIECTAEDALTCRRYHQYNIFFFFNPFGENVMRAVIDRVVQDNAGKERFFVIYHNPVYHQVIENTGCFVKVKELYDSTKQYMTYIYAARWR